MRESWIDRWKGILIFLVVLGHAAGGSEHLTTGIEHDVMSFLYRFIYLFHMPAFFCVSGYLWRTDTGSFGRFILKKAKRLLVPYFIFGMASALVYQLFLGGFVSSVSSGTDGYYAGVAAPEWWQPYLALLHAGGLYGGFRCNSVLWFLPCLFSCSVVMWIWDRAVLRIGGWMHWIGFGLCLIYSIFDGKYRFPTLPWMLTMVPYYLMFIAIGRLLKNHLSKLKLPVAVKYTLAIFGVVFLCYMARWAPDRFQVLRIKPWWFVPYLLAAIAGIWLSLWVAQKLGWKVLASMGAASMGIMLMHKFIILGLQVKCGLCSVWMVLPVTLVATAVTWFANWLISKFFPFLLGGEMTKEVR